MKRLFLLAMLATSALTSACASAPATGPAAQADAAPPALEARKPALPASQIAVDDGNGSVIVQKVEFRSGVSSATVERLGRRFGCNGTVGAGLVTDKGPVEVYRMQCDNGMTFMAQCELRQCRPLR